LIEAFRSLEQEVWVDWESIPPAADWLEQILRGIEEADAFLFMVSPDSIGSEVCKVEIAHAAKNNKRIIPIVLRDAKPQDAPETIRKLNWTFIRETDNFEEGLAKVKTAIELDLDWLEEHRRLQIRALEWHRKKDVSLLLRGRDLRNAEHMLGTYTAKDPIPTDLQRKYIENSRRTERNRTIALLAGTVALIIMAVLAFTTWQQSILANKNADKAREQEVIAVQKADEAETARAKEAVQRQIAETAQAKESVQRQIAEQRKIEAEAQRSAARAQIFQARPGELYTSTLLAIDSMRRNPSEEAEQILRSNIVMLPRPVIQFSQADKINSLAFNRDRSSFVTGSADGTACAWRIQDTVSKIFCTAADQPAVNAVAFNADGSLIAMGDQAGLVQILDSQTGEVLHAYQRIQPRIKTIEFVDLKAKNSPASYTALKTPVRQISFHPTSAQQVVVAYDDGQLPVFNVITGNIGSPLFTGYRINVMSFSPTGTWIVAGSESGNVSIWRYGSNDNFSGAAHRGGVLALAFSSKENKLATGGNDSAAVMSLSSKKQLFEIPNQTLVRDLAFSPDGATLVTASADRRVRIWDATSGVEKLSMSQDGSVSDVVFSANGEWLASTGEDRTVRVWDAETGAQIFEIPLKASGSQLAFCNDDQWLVSTDASGAIEIWDISIMNVPSVAMSTPSHTLVDHVQYSPSGDQLAVSSENQLWLLSPDVESVLSERELTEGNSFSKSKIEKLVFSPDSKRLAVLTAANDLAIYDAASRGFTSLKNSSLVQEIAFSPDSQQLIISDTEDKLHVWDIASSQWLENSELAKAPGSTLASSAQFLAVGSPDEIRVTSMDGKGPISRLESVGKSDKLIFSKDGSLLASVDSEGRVHTWQYQGGIFTAGVSLNNERAVSLAIHPQKPLLAVGTATHVYIMDFAGKELARIPYTDTVSDVSFSADGKYLATASSTLLQIWDLNKIELVESEDLISVACSRLFENLSQPQWQAFFPGDPYTPLCDKLPEAP
jgi:WD40 repeat protein